jgi:hypothetical protein
MSLEYQITEELILPGLHILEPVNNTGDTAQCYKDGGETHCG